MFKDLDMCLLDCVLVVLFVFLDRYWRTASCKLLGKNLVIASWCTIILIFINAIGTNGRWFTAAVILTLFGCSFNWLFLVMHFLFIVLFVVVVVRERRDLFMVCDNRFSCKHLRLLHLLRLLECHFLAKLCNLFQLCTLQLLVVKTFAFLKLL